MYNFKKTSKVYIVYAGLRYSIDVYPDLSFSQTFNESEVKRKTLHEQYNMFDDATIHKANPANFNFTIPLYAQDDLKIVHDLLLDYAPGVATLKTADLYIAGDNDTYKIEGIVVESGIFQLTRDRIILLTVSGTGKKLSRHIGALPGTSVGRTSVVFEYPKVSEFTLDGIVMSSIVAVSLEVRNDVDWLEPDTLHNSLAVTTYNDTVYPSEFVLRGRSVSGSLQQYINEFTTTSANTWALNKSLRIRAGLSSAAYLLDINIPSVVYTNRLDTQEVFVQTYDFRMTNNPTSLSSVIGIR